MILFFGPAGAGKSVQGQKLAESKGWSWLSSGNLLRESTDLEIIDLLSGGNLVPLEKFGSVFADAIKSHSDVEHVILDGFPRKLEQAKWLVDHTPELNRELQIAVVIEIPESELLKRMELRGRADDTPEAIHKRLTTYHNEIDPILSYLEEQNVPIIRIDGVGDPDEIHQRILKELESYQLV